MNANLYALLRSHFAEHLEQPCVLIPGGPVIHYDDLDAAAARIAHALLAAGCVLGDRVAVQTDKCWQVLAVYLACLRAGLVACPSTPGIAKPTRLFLWRCRTARHRVRSCRRRHRRAAHRRDGATLAGDEAACSIALATTRRSSRP
jgi:acyl-CoA synthetase (AMP-forming)/AMP-acid ligase II